MSLEATIPVSFPWKTVRYVRFLAGILVVIISRFSRKSSRIGTVNTVDAVALELVPISSLFLVVD